MASPFLEDELSCSICLNIYTDPVTLNCGHNFCRECIEHVLEQSGLHRCPECRAEFAERPALQKNIALCNIAERFRSAHPHPEDAAVSCTYCIHVPGVAVKSCIHCEAALCEEHLRVHSKSPEHVLVDPSCSMEMWKCQTHKKILEYYCIQDVSFICASCCLMGEHIGHKVVPRREEDMRVLGKISKREDSASDVTQQLSHLEDDLKRAIHRDDDCNIEDSTLAIDGGDAGVGDPEEVLGWTMLRKRFADLSVYMRNLWSLKETPREARNTVQDLILDVDTAGVNVEILEGLRTAFWSGRIRRCLETLDRFGCPQVWSSTRFDTGKHKWKLETSRVGCWRLGVSYGSVPRKGSQSVVGNNNKSWCLLRSNQQYSVIHDDREIQLHPTPSCCLIGIILDYEARRLSFYELCDPVRHLYTFTATFTEPLHAAIWIYNSWVRIRLYDHI